MVDPSDEVIYLSCLLAVHLAISVYRLDGPSLYETLVWFPLLVLCSLFVVKLLIFACIGLFATTLNYMDNRYVRRNEKT